MHKIEIGFDCFMLFCKGYVGQTLPTVGGRAQFTLKSVDEKGLTFTPHSRIDRHHQVDYIKKVLDCFNAQPDNATARLKTTIYNRITMNASYVLRLVDLYRKQALSKGKEQGLYSDYVK